MYMQVNVSGIIKKYMGVYLNEDVCKAGQLI